MTKDEFMKQMSSQLSIPKTVSCRWVKFAVENVAQGQYVNFVPKNEEAAVSEWLEATLSALYFAKQRGGESILQAIIEAAKAPHTLYPREIIGAIDYLRKGGQPESLVKASIDGLLDYDGQLPTLGDMEQDIKAAIKIP